MEIALAAEDHLAEVIGRRIIREAGPALTIGQTFRKNGQGYLKANVTKFQEISKRIPLILFTDLDRVECPPLLIRDWVGDRLLPDNFLFRVVVRETESWLLADPEAIVDFMGIALNRIPQAPDNLENPKEMLLSLVRRCRYRSLKQDLLPDSGSPSPVGLGYNAVLSEFIRTRWNSNRARTRSPSLERAYVRIEQLADRLD